MAPCCEGFKSVDGKVVPYIIPFNEFKNGIKAFCKCYEYIGNYDRFTNEEIFRQIGASEDILTLKNQSNFTNWLYTKMKPNKRRKII